MAGRYYTGPQKAQAVALARVIGAESAGAQLGIDWRTVRRWSEKAGDRPDETVDPGTWRALMELALARVTADVASGKLPSTAVATIAGIAARNAHRDPRPPEPTPADGIVPLERILEQERPDLDREDLGRIVSLMLDLHEEANTRTRTDEDVAAWMDTMRAWWRGEIPATDIPRVPEPEPPSEDRPFLDVFAAFVRTVDLDAEEAAYAEREGERRAVHARQQADIAVMWAELRAPRYTPPDPELAELLAEVDQYLETHR